MKNKAVAFATVGILVGFVLGFFTRQALDRAQPTPPQSQDPAALANSELLPQGHPSPEVIAHLEQLQERALAEPKNAAIRVTLGNSYFDMGRFDAAIRWYEEGLALNPSDINVNTDLGTCYFYAGNPQKAIEVFEHSLQLDATHAQTLQNLGLVQFVTNNFGAAVQAWERLIAAHPDYENVEMIKKRLESARAHLRGDHS